MVGGTGTDGINDFTAIGGTNTMIGGGGTNTFTATGGTSTFFGGSGTNTLSVSGGTGTLFGGSGANTYTFSGAGTYTAIGSTGINTFNVSSGTITITGGAGNNAYNLTGPGTYSITGGAGSNALDVVCAISGDAIYLYQSGSTITVGGTINGANVNATASNMNSVEADGSQASNNVNDNILDAYGMTMGVYLGVMGPATRLSAERVLTRSSAVLAATTSSRKITATSSTSAAITATTSAPAELAGLRGASPNVNVVPWTATACWSGPMDELAIRVVHISFD